MTLPFNGAISHFYTHLAPSEIKEAIENGSKKDILSEDYPYKKWLKKADYEEQMQGLQCELVKMLKDVRDTGKRIIVVFEGRDAAGKGGTIKRFHHNLNPRSARIVALSKPSERERAQWYFQRYIEHLPAKGEITFFDRSWYNRAIVEKVFGFCSDPEREAFFEQLPNFENMLISEGYQLFKIWLNVDRAEQLKRFIERERNPLKQWKLSSIDVEGLKLWDEYSQAIHETLHRSHSPSAPWTIIRSDDKYRARLNSIRSVLEKIDYADKDLNNIGPVDENIVACPKTLSKS